MNVSLTPELEKFVQKKVASGMYQTASEVVREGLRLLAADAKQRQSQVKKLREKLRKSAAQADAGMLIDGKEVLRGLREKIDAIEATQKRESLSSTAGLGARRSA